MRNSERKVSIKLKKQHGHCAKTYILLGLFTIADELLYLRRENMIS
jgi:hypothetical protein